MDRVYAMELVRSFQVGEMSRREFLVKASTALGSIAAASTVLAACTPVTGPTEPVVVATLEPVAGEPTLTATPDGPSILTQMVEYSDGNGGTLMAYVARPAGDGVYPAVVVIQEWWGLNDHIKDVTNRFAA